VNVTIRDHAYSFAEGTFLAGGTLSNAIDMDGWDCGGFIATSDFATGTLTWQVSNTEDGEFVEVRSPAGAANTANCNGKFALATDSNFMCVIHSYRYVKLKSSVVQTAGASFLLTLKA
jgi:hypothetical protein